MGNIVRLGALGGLDENGKNLYILEINSDIFVFECGMKYPTKSNTGIDMIVPDVSYLVENQKRVKAYFISHGHDDTMGGLQYIIDKVPSPVYCSQRTAHMLELTSKGKNIKYDFHVVKSGDSVNINGHELTFFAVTHSAKASLGIAVDTGDGLVVYTGDFIFDYESMSHWRSDVNLMSRLADKGVLALLTESIACNKEGHTSPKHKLTPVIEPIISNNPDGRIFISMFFQNSYGFRECIDLAAKYKRKIFIYGDDLKQLLNETTEEELRNKVNQISLKEYELNRVGNENVIVLIAGQGKKLYSVLDDMANKTDKLFYFKPTDNIIIGNSEVPGVEVYASKVIDDIYRTGAKITNAKKLGVISMHARAEDIKMMISIFKPKYYIPVKGEYQNLFANAQIALAMNLGFNYSNVILLDNGKIAKFEDGAYCGVDQQLELTDVMIDGLVVGDIVSNVIDDRMSLADDGVIILGICVDSKEKVIIGGPDIQLRGVVFIKESDNELYRDLATTFDSEVQKLLDTNKINDEDLKCKIHDTLKYIAKKHTGKDPLVIPLITDCAK